MDITVAGNEATVYIALGEKLTEILDLTDKVGSADKIRIVAEKDSVATVLTSDSGSWEIEVSEGAKLLQIIQPSAAQESDTKAEQFIEVFQGAGSNYEAVRITAPHAFSSDKVVVHLGGEGAHAEVRGLFVGSGSNKHESEVIMRHEKPGCTSSSLFKAIAGDSSYGKFNGMVYVAKGASQTSAEQQFKSLLLSDSARVQTEPQLEIYNDDVSCSHGATVGQLDEVQLFYLESRGFDPITAKKMLIESFAAEVVSLVPDETIQKELLSRVHEQVVAVSQ